MRAIQESKSKHKKRKATGNSRNNFYSRKLFLGIEYSTKRRKYDEVKNLIFLN